MAPSGLHSQTRTPLLLLFVSLVAAASSQTDSDSESSSTAEAQSSAQLSTPVVDLSTSAVDTGTQTVAAATSSCRPRSGTTTASATPAESMPTASSSATAASSSVSPQASPAKAPQAAPPPVSSDSTKMPATVDVTGHSVSSTETKKPTSSPKPSPTSGKPETTSGRAPPGPATTPRPSPSPSPSPTTTPPPPGTPPKVNNANTPTPSPARSSSVEASKPMSTITSVTVINVPQSTTVFAHPNSTFASPVSITALDAAGSSVLTAPPLVTIMSTSTLPDGNVSTVTQIIANPVNGLGNVNAAVEDKGFFQNSGVVAGVFTVVGIVTAAVLAALVFCVRKHRRSQRRKRWLATIKPQRASFLQRDDPFSDPVEEYNQKAPTIRTVASTGEGARSDGHSNTHLMTQRLSAHDGYGNTIAEKGQFVLYPDPYPLFNPERMVRPRAAENQYAMHEVDLGHGIGQAQGHATLQPPIRSPFRAPSYAPSSPSIYPASLPEENGVDHEGAADNANPFNQASVEQTQATGRRTLPVPPTIVVPPRPPRSQLRDSARNLDFAPLTPPDSVAHSLSKPPSPISPVTESHPRDILTRKTLLDVRQRPSVP